MMQHTNRVPTDHALIGKGAEVPIDALPHPVLSVAPVVLSTPSRPVDLQLRVSVPTVGEKLPIILFSHGHGRSNNLCSLNGYGPLVNFYAARGFAVFQPTHLSSKSLNLTSPVDGDPYFWKERVNDLSVILDQMPDIEKIVPQIKGRLDFGRVSVVGHSLGAQTVSAILGMTVTDVDGQIVNLRDPRIKAGVIMGGVGRGEGLSDQAYERLAYARHPDFSTIEAPALVVVGDIDEIPHLHKAGPEWHEDSYRLAPGPKSLLTMHGAMHCFGGISGYDANEMAQNESPEMVSVVQRLTLAYLRSTLYPGNGAWSDACNALKKLEGMAKVESK